MTDRDKILNYYISQVEDDELSVNAAMRAYETRLTADENSWASDYIDPVEERFERGCEHCHVLRQEVQALIQSLAGLGGQVFNWSAGMNATRRKRLASLVLAYLKPVENIHPSLDVLCFELQHVEIHDNERPTKGSQTEWTWTTEGNDGKEEDDESVGGNIYEMDEIDLLGSSVIEPQLFLVDGGEMRDKAFGIAYRRSPDLQDKDGDEMCEWGTLVGGNRVGDRWLYVTGDGRWLPTHVGDHPVVKFVRDNAPDRISGGSGGNKGSPAGTKELKVAPPPEEPPALSSTRVSSKRVSFGHTETRQPNVDEATHKFADLMKQRIHKDTSQPRFEFADLSSQIG